MNPAVSLLCGLLLLGGCASPPPRAEPQGPPVPASELVGVYALSDYLWCELTLAADGAFAWGEGGSEAAYDSRAVGTWSVAGRRLVLEVAAQDAGVELLFESAEIIELGEEYAVLVPRFQREYELLGPPAGVLTRVQP